MNKEINHVVRHTAGKTRLVDYCGSVIPNLGSKSATKKAIGNHCIMLNGKIAKTGDYVKVGDRIKVLIKAKKIKELPLQVDVVFEDNYFMAVNKPGGIAVNGNRYKTVENVFAKANLSNPSSDALSRPIAVHRIDVPTKGIVLLAKTKTAQIQLSRAFQQNQINKTYYAIVHGKSAESGSYTKNIGDKKAQTEFTTIRSVPSRSFGNLSLIELKPITGRTHQLRIHLEGAGHLIVGDKQYAGKQKTILGKGLFLVAAKLELQHPITNQPIKLEIPIPTRFKKILERESGRF